MNVLQLDDSDSSDEDYIPEKKIEEHSSEADSDENTDISLNGESNSNPRKKSRNSKQDGGKTKKFKFDDESVTTCKQAAGEEKKKVDEDLWASFKKDTGFQSRKDVSRNIDLNARKVSSVADDKMAKSKQETVTQVFTFAGEDVTIEKQVPHNSPSSNFSSECVPKTVNKQYNLKGPVSGIGGIVSKLGRKPKMNTLEKSKLDWNKFKKEENIEEELQSHNKGKHGYLERQDFLERADLRRFEIEKQVRTVERNKRVNNTVL